MTIIVGVSSGQDISLLADCRLSGTDARGRVIVRRDVCQKLVAVNEWSVIGFSGHLCLARHLLRGFVSRLSATPVDAPDWLRNNDEVLSFLRQGVEMHAKVRMNADHRPCQMRPVELLIAWVDHAQTFFGESRQPGDPATAPRMETLVIRSPQMELERRPLELQIIGSGAKIHQQMRKEAYMEIAWHGHDAPVGWLYRSFFTAIVVRDLLNDAGESTVGGLYQLASLSPAGVQIIPHFYWAPVEPGYGTYVAMRIKGGEWVQEHRPTGTVVKVMSPFDVQLRHPDWTNLRSKMFDPALSLHRNSPGVIPDRQGRLVYSLYDPTDVPEEVRESWGDAPIAPISWFEESGRRRRRCRP